MTLRQTVRFLRSITYVAYSRYQSIGKGLASSAQLTENGQILVSLDLKKKLPELPSDHAVPVREFAIDRAASDQAPPMSIVIMIVGSRGGSGQSFSVPHLPIFIWARSGDVQPYVALGNRLKDHGHRVRIATHETFRKMVRDAGLEFQSIGGDPAELMSYMVRSMCNSRKRSYLCLSERILTATCHRSRSTPRD